MDKMRPPSKGVPYCSVTASWSHTTRCFEARVGCTVKAAITMAMPQVKCTLSSEVSSLSGTYNSAHRSSLPNLVLSAIILMTADQ